MKVIIAGKRDFYPRLSFIDKAVRESGFEITEVVSGKCSGVDRSGEKWADFRLIPTIPFPADWTTYGKAAGPIRNVQMAQYADALIAVWDGYSKGTGDMINKMRHEGKPVFIHYINNKPPSPTSTGDGSPGRQPTS